MKGHRYQSPWVLLLGSTLLAARGQTWYEAAGYRAAPLEIMANGKTRFTELAPRLTGISFTNLLSEERSLTNQILLNGSGVAAGDVDGDGWCDIYFCGLDSPNALYRNLGNWRFEEITARAGVACADEASTGAAFADIDGDGDLDLLVNGVGRGTRLFLNDGKGHFTEATAGSGLRSGTGSMSMTLADIDGDGLLDLYVVNYREETMRDSPNFNFRIGVTNGVPQLLAVNGQSPTTPEFLGRFSLDGNASVMENGEADVLFHNRGGGKFAAVSWTGGMFSDEEGKPIAVPYDWGLSAMFHDWTGDGAPDLYVCNDFQSPDRLWINDGRGRFREVPNGAVKHMSLFSMGVDFADIDADGFDDFFVADMRARDHTQRQVQVLDPRIYQQAQRASPNRPQVSHNTLFRNRGNGSFAEIAEFSGLDASDWAWCPVFLDVDLDGYEDLLVSTGHGRDLQNADVAREIAQQEKSRSLSARDRLQLRRRFQPLHTPNAAFRNRGDLTFEDASTRWGFDSRRICHGIALADLDNDGDLDVIVNCLNDAPLLYRNECAEARIAIQLRGTAPNTRGVGARIRVSGLGLPNQSAEVHSGGRYLSSDDYRRSFAAGTPTNLLTAEITWRSGRQSLIRGIAANQLIEIDEAQSGSPIPFQVEQQPFFEDLSRMINHAHKDEPYDDFARQPLLPRKLSEGGPGVTWFDFNGDGWEDLLIGTGRGGSLAVFRNDGKGNLLRQGSKLLESSSPDDQTAILGWRPSLTNAALLMGLSTYERTGGSALSVTLLSLTTGKTEKIAATPNSSTGPLAMADVDNDGDLDLFIGGRVMPGRYPEAAGSALLRGENGAFQIDANTTSAFAKVGMVNGALFADLNSDGWPDLVLACEWGPLKIFRNDRGKFQPWDVPVSWNAAPANGALVKLSALTGRWNSIAAGDFDGDGRLDLVAGNWGRNSRNAHDSHPTRLYFGRSEADLTTALFEAHYEPGSSNYVPTLDWAEMTAAFPSLHSRFSNFTSFASADVAQVLAAGLPPLHEVDARVLDSIVLLNRGDHFEAHPLPVEAQFAPVLGLAVGDLDGDGNEDLFLSQNLRGVAENRSPQDAGGGLWLKGDGRGTFEAVAIAESGIWMYGDGRGVALCDFDHDGRIDIVAGQNRGATRLFHNRQAQPGIRVRLRGSRQNFQAVGTTVRLVFKTGRSGPAHLIGLGGGYWSQDGTDIVLGNPAEAEAIDILWPGGQKQRISIPQGQLFVEAIQPMP